MSVSTVTVDRRRAGWLARLADFVELSKPRIGMLVLMSVAVSYWVASRGQVETSSFFGVLAGTLLIAASASAANQLREWRRDALMDRTACRPLPALRLRVRDATLFTAATCGLGVAIVYFAAGTAPLLWALLTWILYVFVYTPSKIRTPWNTLIGAIPGAMPILIGWSATKAPLDVHVGSLYVALFLWQFPHFMAIAWRYRHQYERAGMRMLSVVDPTGRRAGFHAVVAAAALVPISVAPAWALPGIAGGIYAVLALVLSLGQLGCACAFRIQLTDQAARRLLRCSLVYLPLLLLLQVSIPWQH